MLLYTDLKFIVMPLGGGLLAGLSSWHLEEKREDENAVIEYLLNFFRACVFT